MHFFSKHKPTCSHCFDERNIIRGETSLCIFVIFPYVSATDEIHLNRIVNLYKQLEQLDNYSSNFTHAEVSLPPKEE